MEIRKTSLEGVLVIEPPVFRDARGFFVETYHTEKFAAGGLDVTFVQDNHSKSSKGTLRGLHGQHRKPQGKLVRALEGEIFDVAIDIRKGSPTWGQWYGEILTADNFLQLYVPPWCLHGFLVLSESAQVAYKCTDVYDPGYELGVRWNDPEIGIEWPYDGEPLLSGKDAEAPLLSEIPEEHLPHYKD